MSSKNASTSSTHLLSPSAALFSTTGAKDFRDVIKPYKNEAVIRLRNSTVGLVALVMATHLLPMPSLWTAVHVVRGSTDRGLLWGVCIAELVLSVLIALNLVQAAYALKYPRKPLPPLPSSPAKGLVTPQSQKKRRTILSPAVRISTFYSICCTPSPFNTSINSSTMSLPPTPSPSLSVYHARHPVALGQSFDGLSLSRLTGDELDEDE
ncbi:hypothetical protein ID866_10644 [Astraeus odoratus]|nr:hypothetical protein ID866_10644 [Astraeus odoratus]